MRGAVVKVVWRKNGSNQWYGTLKLAGENGFRDVKLVPGMDLECELLEERRCTGYAPEPGERVSCPEFREIDSGSQCGECRGKDIYTDYVRGDQRTDLEGDFSVYLAQVGSRVKVGVTRSSKIEKRWIEQGADFGVELESGLESSKALERESEISSKGLSERVRKEHKAKSSEPCLEEKMDKLGVEGEIVDLRDRSIYQETSCTSFRRSGRLPGRLESVKGQIMSNGTICLALSSGKLIDNSRQKGLDAFS